MIWVTSVMLLYRYSRSFRALVMGFNKSRSLSTTIAKVEKRNVST